MSPENDGQPTVMVVDDDPMNLDIMLLYLEEWGFHTLIAQNGERALQQLAHGQPDVMLLDVMMPGLDGFETCRRMKAREATAQIPVIFMTALDDLEHKVKGFQVGAVDYITKPFQQEEVLARVRTHATLRTLQKNLEKKNRQLEQALAQVTRLSGLLPICANCKKIRNDKGYWEDVTVYVRQHSEADFSHGICPDCAHELYPELYRK